MIVKNGMDVLNVVSCVDIVVVDLHRLTPETLSWTVRTLGNPELAMPCS